MGIIESSNQNLDMNQLIPSFFEWLFGETLFGYNGELFGIGLLITVGMVSFLTLKGFRYDKAMIVSSIITWIVGFLLLRMEMISSGVFVIVCIYVAIAIYFLMDKSSQEEV